ncbi:MAG: flagellar hook protein FlgE [Gammaproteobacteria bacterium]|nr:flagellar hook protein FlgE [Gammaproteobacteria bacterium]PCH62673.1 MAG: flagellar hook protein FlgE [Gammaproteobacteria bacterium]
MPFRTALSGINAASSQLQVIGNNIANANTTGFKSSRTEFADVFAASSIGAASDAIGSGVRVSNVTQQFSQGSIDFTDNGLDVAINGNGFFQLADASNGGTVYSRDGAFSVDATGFIVNSRGDQLQARTADTSGNITANIGGLQVNTGALPPTATTSVELGLNLDATAVVPAITPFDANNPATFNSTTSLSVFDSQGGSQLATTYYVKTGDNAWNTHVLINGTELAPTAQALTFNTNGTLATPADGAIDYAPFALGGGTAPLALTLDYSGAGAATSQFGAAFSVDSLNQNGFPTGQLTGIDISSDGVLLARFSNGQSNALGQIQLANFDNPQGLRQLGNNTWVESADSGVAQPNIPGVGGVGLLQSGALEGSNVDITEELVAIISAQRSFQANAEVITTADALTQTIINIR